MKKNYIYAFTTVLIWATLAAVVKVLLNDIPDFQALSVSSLFAFVFLVIVNIINGSYKLMRKYTVSDYLRMAGLGFVGLFLYSSLYYYGLSRLASQEACILNYLWPMMLVVFSCIILKEKVTPKKVAAMAASFLGVIILTSGSSAATGGDVLLGRICCIAAAVCYGLFSVLNKKEAYNQNIAMMVIWLTTAICSFAAGKATEQWVPIRGVQWIGLLWLGIVINAVAYLFWALALGGSENTASIANLAYLTPFLSLIISAIFLKEKIQLRAVIALVLIVGGILLQNIPAKKRERNLQ